MDVTTPFSRISNALRGKPPQQTGGTINKVGYDSRAGDMTTRDANIAKMKALGLQTMPEGGQEDLDIMYAQHVKRVQGAK